jgi:hypothetical protein
LAGTSGGRVEVPSAVAVPAAPPLELEAEVVVVLVELEDDGAELEVDLVDPPHPASTSASRSTVAQRLMRAA